MTLHVSLAHHIAFVLCTVELAAVLRMTLFSATVQGVLRQRRRPCSTLSQSFKFNLTNLRVCTEHVLGGFLGGCSAAALLGSGRAGVCAVGQHGRVRGAPQVHAGAALSLP